MSSEGTDDAPAPIVITGDGFTLTLSGRPPILCNGWLISARTRVVDTPDGFCLHGILLPHSESIWALYFRSAYYLEMGRFGSVRFTPIFR